MRRRILSVFLVLTIGILGLALAAPVNAAVTRTWVGGSGWWDYAANWSPAGQPQLGDTVNLTQSDATDRIVRYFNTLYPSAVLNTLKIDATGSGTMTLRQWQHSLSANSEYIGFDGTGTFTQTGGSNSIINGLFLGHYSTDSNGTYNLSDGDLSADNEYIGNSGTGTFTQTGGSNSISGTLYLGYYEFSVTGTYTLAGGTLDVGGNIIGGAGDSYLNIDGGTLNVGGGSIDVNYFRVGYNSGSNGSFTLNSGNSLSVGYNEIIGDFGTGIFTQTGGSNAISNSLSLGENSGSNGTYNLSGTDSNLAADNEIIGIDGNGKFTQTGGTNTIGYSLSLGYNSTGSGTYTLAGGTLNVGGNIIGGDGDSYLNIDGGILTVGGGSINVNDFSVGYNSGSNGSFTLNSGNSLSADYEYIGYYGIGTFTQNGGTNSISNYLSLGNNSGSKGTYDLSGTGSLAADLEYIGNDSTGTFTQNGGTNSINSELYLGFNSDGKGTYDLRDGSLTAIHEYIGYDGNGTFTQNGGTNTVTITLTIAANPDSSGSYNLSDTGNLSAYSESIGESGKGIFTQTGGTHAIAGLSLGNNSTGDGSYDLSGTGILLAEDEVIGDDGTGTFTQNGGSNNIDIGLYLGYSSDGHGTYNLSGTGSLTAGDEFIGYVNTGAFTQNGGTHTVTNTLTIAVKPGSNGSYDLQGGTLNAGTVQLNSEGTFTQTGGTLDAGTFNQDGGTVNGTLQNQGNFNYNSGDFNGRLLNLGWINLYADFTAGDGLENRTSFYINQNRTVTLNGSGLDNQGTLTLYGTLEGNGPLVNNGIMGGGGTIGGSGGFINNGLYTPYSGAGISNTGENVNYGNIDLYNSGRLHLTGSGLTNSGTLNLTVGNQEGSGPGIGMVTGTGTLDNSYGGTIVGRGIISTPFSNSGGVLLVQNGTTNVTQAFINNGLIQLTDYTASLTGGTIANPGSIEGHGHVGNDVDNTGTIEAIGGTLTLSGVAVNNNAGGLVTASAGTKILLANGMAANGTAANAGVINLTGGTFDNNNYSLTNTGQISGYGILRTGGLSNEGSMTFSGGQTTVNGMVTNQAGRTIEVAYDPALFTGDVVNEGTFKTTHANVVFAGSFTNNGAYLSDPSTNYFTTLVIGTGGYMQGETGDSFYISEDLINHSTQDTLWNTTASRLGFTGVRVHELYLTGLDRGQDGAGYTDNFAWGIFSLGSGSGLKLMDDNIEPGRALYVQSFLLGDGLSQINDITGNGMNIYYAPNAPGNDYLNSATYALGGGGYLTPIPEPSTLLLLGSGLVGLMRLRRKKSVS